MFSAFSSVDAGALAAPFGDVVDVAAADADADADDADAAFVAAASKAFASRSCRVTDPSVPTDALHINTRGALLRVVNGRWMLFGTCGR